MTLQFSKLFRTYDTNLKAVHLGTTSEEIFSLFRRLSQRLEGVQLIDGGVQREHMDDFGPRVSIASRLSEDQAVEILEELEMACRESQWRFTAVRLSMRRMPLGTINVREVR